MNRLPSISAVQTILREGECGEIISAFAHAGLLFTDERTGSSVATSTLVRVGAELPNEMEAVAAVFACATVLRRSWLSIIAARLRETGRRRDASELCNAIDQLGVASETIRQMIPSAKLQSTGYGDLETEVFGAQAEQSVAWPKLLRVVAATADLVEGAQNKPVLTISPVEPLNAPGCWCSGRILQLPRVIAEETQEFRFVLPGNFGPLTDIERVVEDSNSQAIMRWVLLRPWIMLLAQVVFVQEAWLAEQISGHLTLELADDQMVNPYQPNRVDVIITTADGDEILCGTLGDLVQRVLSRLNITMLGRSDETSRLDERLSAVIRSLLEKRIWRFDPTGGGSGRPGFIIDDEFSTSCYRAFGSKYFYRGGSVLTNAIRLVCEQWGREKLTGLERSPINKVIPEIEFV